MGEGEVLRKQANGPENDVLHVDIVTDLTDGCHLSDTASFNSIKLINVFGVVSLMFLNH